MPARIVLVAAALGGVLALSPSAHAQLAATPPSFNHPVSFANMVTVAFPANAQAAHSQGRMQDGTQVDRYAAAVDHRGTYYDARVDASLIIVARSELRGDFSEKADRLQEAAEAGADVFWLGTVDPAEMKTLCERIRKPGMGVLSGNLDAAEYERRGARMGVLPNAMAVAALSRHWLKKVGATARAARRVRSAKPGRSRDAA